MARYIDADKVMEEIARMGGHGLCEWSTLGVKALINRQPTADVEPRAEWISVEERLPETEGWYLVYTAPDKKHRSVNKAEFCKGFEWNNFEPYWRGAGGNWGNVTHWMPLPEPPKAKQPKDSENYEKKRLLAGDCFHGEIWYMCPYCFTGIEAYSIPKDRICYKCGKEYLR